MDSIQRVSTWGIPFPRLETLRRVAGERRHAEAEARASGAEAMGRI